MVATQSTMGPLGSIAPEFTLTDVVTGRNVAFSELRLGKRASVVMFLCNHCPYVKHVRAELARFGRDHHGKSVAIVAISSNDAQAYPADGPDLMRAEAMEAGYPFPYLYDESQSVARAFGAACTPDFFVFDAGGRLAYRGQLDGSRPKSEIPVTGQDLRGAVEAVLEGRAVPEPQIPSIGCNIKWKPVQVLDGEGRR